MKKTLGRAAGAVLASALLTLAVPPAAFAQTDSTTPTSTDTPTSTTSTTTTTSSSGPSTTSAPSTSDAPSSASDPVQTTGTEPLGGDVKAKPDAKPVAPARTSQGQDPFQNNVGHGFVGKGGEGVLVIACAEGAPGNLATKDLTVTGGPDQDGADGRLWNYSVRLTGDYPAPGVTEPFSWTCAGKDGSGVVEFQQPTPPPTSTTSETPTSSAPATSTSAPATSSTAPAGNSAPKAEVKVSPAGGVETGGGGTAF